MSKLDTYIEHLEDAEKPCTLHCENGKEMVYVPDSAEWFEWLSLQKAVRFVGVQGTFTARQERIIGRDKKPRGGQYWFAYRKFKGHSFKRYLGTNSKLSLEYLEESARLIEEAITQKFGVSARETLPKSSSPKQDNEKLLQSRIEELEQTIAEQRARIQELEAQLQASQSTKKRALPKTDATLPDGFTYLSDFCTLHHVPYQVAADLFPRAIRGQSIKAGGRKHPVIGPKGRHDFYVQMHTRVDLGFQTCDDCPHKEEE